jgi:hypothetical protein
MSRRRKYVDVKNGNNSGNEERLSQIESLAAACRSIVSSNDYLKGLEVLKKLYCKPNIEE